jgi:hypothetical protein
MKGIVFNLLEEVVTREFGADTWDALLEKAGVDGAFTSLGSYPDEDLLKLVTAASEALNRPAGDVIRWFGVQAIPLLAKKYPGFFSIHRETRPFLLTINGMIHPEVRKLYPGADVPDFVLDDSFPDILIMGYHSKRKLCAFAEGLIEGAPTHFGEVATIRHPACMHRGDSSCRLEISFFKARK